MNLKIGKNISILLILISTSVFSQTVSIELAQQYYAQGELEKALDTYSKLAKNPANWQIIHKQFFSLLIQLNELKQAGKYIDKLIRSYPQKPNYQIDKGKLILIDKGEERAAQYYQQLRNQFSNDAFLSRRAAQYFLQIG